MSRGPPARDVESRESLGTEEVREKERRGESLARSLFWVLTRGEAREGKREEVERREDDVEERMDGWREEQEEGWATKREEGWGIAMEV